MAKNDPDVNERDGIEYVLDAPCAENVGRLLEVLYDLREEATEDDDEEAWWKVKKASDAVDAGAEVTLSVSDLSRLIYGTDGGTARVARVLFVLPDGDPIPDALGGRIPLEHIDQGIAHFLTRHGAHLQTLASMQTAMA